MSNSQGLACSNRHQFDRAKEGYYHLLPVQYKNSLEPGDAKEQLLARRRFLSAGFFDPLAIEITKLLPPQVASILDIGCGEGYFTRTWCNAFPQADVYGVDIAKAGIRLAAKGSDITFVVASSFTLPIADTSMDAIIRIYAPSKDDELLRVLSPNGLLIIVTPGDKHLIRLRAQIYQQVRPMQAPKTPEGFIEYARHSVSFPLNVPAGDLSQSLLQMTPFLWKLNAALEESIVNEGIMDHADFTICVYRKF
jgi:23S rRNA (guanine745-N1)-methyltransferase